MAIDTRPPPQSSADRIRAYIVEHYLEPARANGVREIEIRAGDVHKEIGLNNRMPAVCSVLDGKLFREQSGLELIDRSGPSQGANAVFRFRVIDEGCAKITCESEPTSTRFATAFAYAALAHGAQKRKGARNIPYISHLMSVSALVMEYDGDEDQAIAGLLHDVIEDCGAWHEPVIREQFGERVARIVRACTDGVADATGKKPPWRARKERYLTHLQTVGEDVLLVSACDKLHNARAIAADLEAKHDVFAWFNPEAARDGTLWYYNELVHVFRARMGEDSLPVRALATAVAQISLSASP